MQTYLKFVKDCDKYPKWCKNWWKMSKKMQKPLNLRKIFLMEIKRCKSNQNSWKKWKNDWNSSKKEKQGQNSQHYDKISQGSTKANKRKGKRLRSLKNPTKRGFQKKSYLKTKTTQEIIKNWKGVGNVEGEGRSRERRGIVEGLSREFVGARECRGIVEGLSRECRGRGNVEGMSRGCIVFVGFCMILCCLGQLKPFQHALWFLKILNHFVAVFHAF